MPWSERRACAISRRRLAEAKHKIIAVAGQWGDVDQYIVEKCDELVAAIEELTDNIDEQIAYRANEAANDADQP